HDVANEQNFHGEDLTTKYTKYTKRFTGRQSLTWHTRQRVLERGVYAASAFTSTEVNRSSLCIRESKRPEGRAPICD
ncbi:MAG TPA: hypothetical protein VL863_10225, partial [bacterium]|nr:hypothetical protein [bacterium]